MSDIGQRLGLGLSTTGVGMLVVFLGLAILILCISVMTAITGRKKKQAPPQKVSAAPPAPQPERQAEIPAPEAEDDGSLIAVITAAVAAVWQREGIDSGFVVRRVRRVQTSTARARAARDEQIYSRF